MKNRIEEILDTTRAYYSREDYPAFEVLVTVDVPFRGETQSITASVTATSMRVESTPWHPTRRGEYHAFINREVIDMKNADQVTGADVIHALNRMVHVLIPEASTMTISRIEFQIVDWTTLEHIGEPDILYDCKKE